MSDLSREQKRESFSQWLIVAVAVACLALGFIGALVYLSQDSGEPNPPAYVSFQKLEATGNVGMVVVSLDVETDGDGAALIKQHQKELSTRFRTILAATPVRELYSRAGKEVLAQRLQTAADEELGARVAKGIYFGDFRVYSP